MKKVENNPKVNATDKLKVSKLKVIIGVSVLNTRRILFGKGCCVVVFSSTVFLFLFLPLVLMVYFVIRKEFRNAFLFLASSFFYWYGEQKMLLLMYFVILLNYSISLLIGYIDDKKLLSNWTEDKVRLARKSLLLLCITICVGLLWYYKYWNFTIGIFNKLALLVGINYKLSFVDKIILPLGISFYTFHVLSYTLDVYSKKMRADKNLLNFMTYVLMFPQLVAGPIVRYIDIQKQFTERVVSAVGFANGIRKFSFGLAKKILIANTVAKIADKIFAVPVGELELYVAWLGAICYSLQIYFDFSGYSDMAIGLAKMFGFHYKENFNYPYISKTIGEFWRRWHISLSTWLRDYVYINLGGNRLGRIHFYFNILVVFLLSGLWHGANMTFVLWGMWYGIFIILESIWLKEFLAKRSTLAHIYTLLVVIFGWVLFRADSVNYALGYWKTMCMSNGVEFSRVFEFLKNDVILAIIFGIVFSADWRGVYKKIVIGSSKRNYHRRFFLYKLVSYVISMVLLFISAISIISSTYNPFIYFRF